MSKQKKAQRQKKQKVCAKCQVLKPLSKFGRHREYGKIKRNRRCKQCNREFAKAYRQKPGQREKRAAYMREYRKRFRQKRLKPG